MLRRYVALYEIKPDGIRALPATSWVQEGLKERGDLQRLLCKEIGVLSMGLDAPKLLVIEEEYNDWDESNRRIDILALDEHANLVVVELKRTEDGGHMELQALRYAAMVSAMKFDQLVRAYSRYREIDQVQGEREVLDFLGWDELEPENFAKDVRIILASSNFSKEITTSVLWLNRQGHDIQCFRMVPYKHGPAVLLDVQRIIPLPEASSYQVQVIEKEQAERMARRTEAAEPWNGRDWYVSFQNDATRSWEDAVRYGFVSAGGGEYWTAQLDRLPVGARIFVNAVGIGYVGIGLVRESRVPVTDFKVKANGVDKPILQCPLTAKSMGHDLEDRDKCENLVRVEWIKTVGLEGALYEKGLFRNQKIACRLKNAGTIRRVEEHLNVKSA